MQLDHEISGFRVMAFMYLSYTYPSVNNVIVNLGLASLTVIGAYLQIVNSVI